MRSLVTGAAGFIGSRLVEALLARGDEVIAVDDMSAGEWHDERPGLEWYEEPAGEIRGWRIKDLDRIFHLAARIGVGQILKDPRRMLEEHVEDIQSVIYCARNNKAQLVIASTSEIYGSGRNLTETDAPQVAPPQESRSGYAVTKLYAEQLALAMYRQHGLRVVIPRYFNVAGPRQRAEGGCVVPIFARQALTNEAITLHGQGEQVRCYAHVTDAVEATIRLSDCEAANGQIVNVGATTARETAEVASAVAGYCNRHYVDMTRVRKIPYAELSPDGSYERMQVRIGNVNKLEKLTGMRFADRFTEIISDACDWWATKLNVPRRNDGRILEDCNDSDAGAGGV